MRSSTASLSPPRLTWAEIEALTDDQLEARLYAAAHPTAAPARPTPDWAAALVELLPTACCLRQVDRGSAITSDLTRLRLGFTAHSARRFTASVCTRGMLVPLLPAASRRHAGDRATCLLDCFQDGLLSFHGQSAAFVAHINLGAVYLFALRPSSQRAESARSPVTGQDGLRRGVTLSQRRATQSSPAW